MIYQLFGGAIGARRTRRQLLYPATAALCCGRSCASAIGTPAAEISKSTGIDTFELNRIRPIDDDML
jgi:hypothetical protein